MKNFKTNEISKNFLLAAKNQQAFDCIYYHLNNQSAENFCFIPRPAKWLNMGVNFIRAIEIFSKPLTYFWAYCLFYFYTLIKFLTIISKFKDKNKPTTKSIVAYAACEHSIKTIAKTCHSLSDVIWLSSNKKQISNEFTSKFQIQTIEPIQFLSRMDILDLFRLSIKAHHHIIKNHGVMLSWQSYTAFDWLLQYGATLNINPNIVLLAEHHDRWAVLADIYCIESNHFYNKCFIHLTQHGKEHAEVYELMKKIYSIDGLPYKMKCISKLFVYDDIQLNLFRENIIETGSTGFDSMEVCIVKQSINLKDVEKKSILFIGHSICEEYQVALRHKLSFLSDFYFYYKPHPTSSPSKTITSQDWLVIKDKNFFPRVSFTISYPSTLVDEYASEDIQSVLHSLNATHKELDANLIQIKKILYEKNYGGS